MEPFVIEQRFGPWTL